MYPFLIWLWHHWYDAILLIGIVLAVWYEIRHKDKLYQDGADR